MGLGFEEEEYCTYFSQSFGEFSTSRSMTISPRLVSRSTLILIHRVPVSCCYSGMKVRRCMGEIEWCSSNMRSSLNDLGNCRGFGGLGN